MLIFCLIAILQLVAGQYSLGTKLIPGPPDSCQSREQRAAIDVAIQDIHHARDEFCLHSVLTINVAVDHGLELPISICLTVYNSALHPGGCTVPMESGLVDVKSPHQQLEDVTHTLILSDRPYNIGKCVGE